MKAKRSLVIVALILFAINALATALSGFGSVMTMKAQVPLFSMNFLWTVFNAIVGVVVAVFLLASSILNLKGKGEMAAACAFFLCAVQNFLSFAPYLGVYPVKTLLLMVASDWICALAYLAVCITAVLKWRGKIAGIIGAGVVLAIRMFAMIRTIVVMLQAQVAMQYVLPSMLPNFLFCILCLNLGIFLYVLAQKKKA